MLFAWLACCLSFLPPSAVLGDAIHIPGAMAPVVERLLAGPEALGPCRLGDVKIADAQIAVQLHCPDTPTEAVATLLPLDGASDGRLIATTASFSLWLNRDAAAAATVAAQVLGNRIRVRDDGRFFVRAQSQPTPTQPPAQPAPPPRAPDRAQVGWLLVLWFAVPIALGAILGAGVIRRLPRPLRLRNWLFIAVLLLAMPALLFGLGLRLPLGFQDQEALLLVVGLSAHWFGAHRPRLAWLVTGATTVLAFLAAEGGVRAFVAAPPTFPNAGEAHLLADASRLDFGCQALFDPEPPSPLRHDPVLLARPRRVLHLGDSMVAGNGLTSQEDNFTALLDRRHSDVWNVNAGDPGTTMDTHLLWLRKHLAQVKPELVVVYALTVNDVDEMDRPYVCCGMGPLLNYEPTGPISRCPVEQVREPLLYFIAYSPPPLPLRAATAVSHLARHAMLGLGQASAQFADTFVRPRMGTESGTETQWRHFALALSAMKLEVAGAHASFVLVVLPSRRALGSSKPERTLGFATQRRMVRLGEEAGIRTLDAWALFADVVRTDGTKAWFVDPPAWDCHFNAAGHARLADWLDAALFVPK